MTSSVGDISHWEFSTKLFTLIDYSLEIKTFGLGSRIGDILLRQLKVAILKLPLPLPLLQTAKYYGN